jgi:Niemann-Pick C1 protein
MDKIGRPEPTAFSYYLPFFLQDNPSDSCAKGGHAAYGQVSYQALILLPK